MHVAFYSPLFLSLQNETLDVPDFPTNPSAGSHKVPFNHIVYIDSSDFKEAGEKGKRVVKCVGYLVYYLSYATYYYIIFGFNSFFSIIVDI